MLGSSAGDRACLGLPPGVPPSGRRSAARTLYVPESELRFGLSARAVLNWRMKNSNRPCSALHRLQVGHRIRTLTVWPRYHPNPPPGCIEIGVPLSARNAACSATANTRFRARRNSSSAKRARKSGVPKDPPYPPSETWRRKPSYASAQAGRFTDGLGQQPTRVRLPCPLPSPALL